MFSSSCTLILIQHSLQTTFCLECTFHSVACGTVSTLVFLCLWLILAPVHSAIRGSALACASRDHGGTMGIRGPTAIFSKQSGWWQTRPLWAGSRLGRMGMGHVVGKSPVREAGLQGSLPTLPQPRGSSTQWTLLPRPVTRASAGILV